MREHCEGISYERFLQIVLPAIVQDPGWPALKSLWVAGFSPTLAVRLQDHFGESVEITSVLGRQIIPWTDSGEIESAGDVLDSANGFDYSSEASDNDEPCPLWQCWPAKSRGEIAFGLKPRLA